MKTLNSAKDVFLSVVTNCALLAAGTIVPLTLLAQTPQVNQPDETAAHPRPARTDQACHRLIDNYLTVIGGQAAYRQLKNLVASGTIEEAGKLKSFELIETRDGRRHLNFRWKVRGRPHHSRHAFDGITTWKQELLPKQTPPVTLKGRDAAHFARQRWLLQPFVLPLKADYTFNYQGKAKVSGRPAYLICGHGKQNVRSWFYFDQQKSLLTRWGGKASIAGVEAHMDYRATRFAAVNGVLLPKQIDLLAEDAPFGSITFDTIRANQAIDPTQFKMPRSTSPLLRQQSRQR
jgi:hypothetical protein